MASGWAVRRRTSSAWRRNIPRPPNLNELFQAGFVQNQAINDPTTGTSYTIQQTTTGNPALKPEKADTLTLGAVYRPEWLRGLAMSVDYFDIKVKGAIFTQAGQVTIDQCRAGVTSQCQYITRDQTSGLITRLTVMPLNVNSEGTKGLDFELSYRANLSDWTSGLSGNLTLRAVGTHVNSRYVISNGIRTEYAGQNANLSSTSDAVPSWRWMGNLTYERGAFSTTLTERFISAGKINNAWGPSDLAGNHVPAVAYTDLSVSYDIKRIGKPRDSSRP